MTPRERVLRAWLRETHHEFRTELELTTSATRELASSGEELDWLAREWRKLQQLELDHESVASADQHAGAGSAPQKTPDMQEETTMPEPSADTQPASTIAIRDPELDRFARLGRWLALSESNKDDEVARGAAAALRLFYARELGLPPMAAAELSVIKGRLFVQAKLLRALAHERGYRVTKVASTDEACTAALVEEKTGQELGRSTYTIEQAKRAGLIRDKSTWQTYPSRMLWARASKYVIDDYAPEVSLGLKTFDELEEIDQEPPPTPPDEAFDVDDAEWEATSGEAVEAASA